jgi:hypothetical protein
MYKFAVGDEVTILDKEAITRTLDSENKLENCIFMDQMEHYCGKSYKVLKIVKNVYHYGTNKLIKSRGPIYILGDLLCDGKVGIFEQICDKCCYLLWHENWLKKI